MRFPIPNKGYSLCWFIILSVLGWQASAQNKTITLKEFSNFSIVFPTDSVTDFKYSNTKVYTVMSDSVQFFVGAIHLPEAHDPDSINLIDGTDANVFQYIEQFKGKLTYSEQIRLKGRKAIEFHFDYPINFPDTSDGMKARCKFIYLDDRHWLLVMFGCLTRIEPEMVAIRTRFFDSLNFNN